MTARAVAGLYGIGGSGPEVAWSLRAWARGQARREAAVELLIRSVNGWLVDPSRRWMISDPTGGWSLNTDAITEAASQDTKKARPGREVEYRVLVVVDMLLTGRPVAELTGLLAGLDRRHRTLVLAAIAYASGPHDFIDVTTTGETLCWSPTHVAAPSSPVLTRPSHPLRRSPVLVPVGAASTDRTGHIDRWSPR